MTLEDMIARRDAQWVRYRLDPAMVRGARDIVQAVLAASRMDECKNGKEGLAA